MCIRDSRLIKNATQQLKSSDDGVDALLAQERTLNAALAETVALASTDVLLPELMDALDEVGGARALVEATSVFRQPVDLNAIAFQLGVEDQSVATSPSVDESAVVALFETAGVEATDEGFDPAQLPNETQQELQRLLQVKPSPPRRLDLDLAPVSYTHLRAHETVLDLVCRLLLEKKKQNLTQPLTSIQRIHR